MMRIVSISCDNMRPEWELSSHTKTAIHTLILVTYGKVLYRLNDEDNVLEAGDYLYYPPGVKREASNVSEGPHQKYFVQFKLEENAAIEVPDKIVILKTQHYEYLKQRFVALNQHWLAQMPFYKTICSGIAVELVGYITRESAIEQIASIKLRLMEKVKEYIMEHYREMIRISELSQLIDRTPNYITRTFTEVTGLSPTTYMHHLRIQTASTLMMSSNMTIGQIAEYLGYTDQSHFTKMFKKITGYPPSSLLH